MGADLGLAGIKTITALMMYSIDEIEESLKRPAVRGAKYRLALFERKQLAAMGLAISDSSQASRTCPPSPLTSNP